MLALVCPEVVLVLGVVGLLVIISTVLLISACMLSSKISQEEEYKLCEMLKKRK